MSHASNVYIPAKFSFRPFTAKWIVTYAEVVDWWEEPPPSKSMLFAPVSPPIEGFGKSMLRELVQVTVNVPSQESMEADSHPLGIPLWLFAPSFTVMIYRDELPAGVLQPHENRKTCPDIAGRSFEVLACPMPEWTGFLAAANIKPGAVCKNAWAMTDEFFELKENAYDLSRFLNRWGLWNLQSGYENGMRFERHPFVLCFPHRIWGERERYRKALTGSANSWLSIAHPLDFSPMDEPPYFLVQRSTCEDAIQATITIDKLAGLEFGFCKRQDCRRRFERKTAQKRLYCTPECAHLANVRKLRAEKRKAKPTQKARKKDAKG